MLGLQRRVVDADVGSVSGGEQLGLIGQVERGAFVVPALGVDRGDRARLEADGLGRFGERLARDARVLDLVVHGLHLAGDALGRDLLFQRVLDLVEGLRAARRDADDPHDRRTELALDDLADAVLRQRERGVGDRLIEHRRLGGLAEIDVGSAQIARLDDVVEARSRLDLRLRVVGRGLVGEDDLLQLALLRRGEARVANLVVVGLGVVVGHVGGIGERARIDEQDFERAVFRRSILILALVEIGLEHVVGGGGNVARRARRQRDIVDRAGLRLDAGEQVDERLRRGEAVDQRRLDLLAHVGPALGDEEAALGEAGIAQGLIEARRG